MIRPFIRFSSNAQRWETRRYPINYAFPLQDVFVTDSLPRAIAMAYALIRAGR